MSSAGTLAYSLNLNTSAFASAMKQAIGLVVSYKAAMAAIQQLGKVIALGSELTHLSRETGEAVGDLLVLKQSFEDVGLGSGEMQTALKGLNKSLSGISETGQRTEETFAALGLNIERLRGQSAEEQFKAIGAALNQLPSQADKVAAAMNIFGRSGTGVLRLIADPEAIEKARASLGTFPALLNATAAKTEALSTAWGRLKTSTQGFWTGILAPMLDTLQMVVDKIGSIDFAKIGMQVVAVGKAVQDTFGEIDFTDFSNNLFDAIFTAFGSAVGELFGLLLNPQFWKGVGIVLLHSLELVGIGLIKLLTTAFTTVAEHFAAALGLVVDKTMKALSFIPGLGSLGEGRDRTYNEHLDSAKQTGAEYYTPNIETRTPAEAFGGIADGAKLWGKIMKDSALRVGSSVSESEAGKNLLDIGESIGQKARDNLAKTLAEINAPSKAKPAEETPAALQEEYSTVDDHDQSDYYGPAEERRTGGYGGGVSIEPQSDRWAKLGAFVGGTIDARLVDHAAATAKNTSALVSGVAKLASAFTRQVPATL